MKGDTMKRYLLATFVIAAALIGCDETIYKIELTPKGDKLIRTLTVWREGDSPEKGLLFGGMPTSLPANEKERLKITNNADKIIVKPMDSDELTAVAMAYSKKKPEGGARKHKFTGTFASVMPNDVGSSGRFLRYESKMGIASSYIERFRGNDRPGEAIEASLKAVDEVTNLLIGYLETQLGKETEFPKLRKFMDTELRKDLKNISAYSYLLSSTSRLNWLDATKDDQEILGQEVMARVVAYIIERRYIETSDIPFLKRHFSLDEEDKAAQAMILNRIAAKAGITDSKFIARLTSMLTDRNNLETSFNAYIQTTPQYKKLIKELIKGQKLANAEPYAPQQDTQASERVVKPLLEKAVHIQFLGGWDVSRLDIQLTLPVKPAITNGKWNAKDRTVKWNGKLTKRNEATTFLPEICYALWYEPDEKFQTARFGKTILSGKQLMNYCLWRNGLTADKAKLWDAKMMKFKPGDSLDEADSDKPTPYTEGLGLLRDALKEKEPTSQPAK
jgi:hypothetical protein